MIMMSLSHDPGHRWTELRTLTQLEWHSIALSNGRKMAIGKPVDKHAGMASNKPGISALAALSTIEPGESPPRP